MSLQNVRLVVQHISFVILMYGGRAGIYLSPALPCFACPYVVGCGGHCYLMGLQGYIGFGMSIGSASGYWIWSALGFFLLFAVLVAILGKSWCGWICPFGLLQDWLTFLRNKLGIRERQIKSKKIIASVKYILLIYLAIIPILVTANFLPEDFYLPFCNICPAKALLPLFAGETKYLALDFNNPITLTFSILLLTITGLMLVGMFYKERFFCLFCPMLALIHLLKPLTGLRLIKNVTACLGCGNCRRCCPMDISKVYEEKIKQDVQTSECLACFKCLEACPAQRALRVNFINRKLLSSQKPHSQLVKGEK